MKTANTTGLWAWTTKTLGKLWAEVLAFPDDRRQMSARAIRADYPRFPPF